MAPSFNKVPWKLYLSRVISAWGDRMWMFAVGLFMVELSPGSLKWPAIYGLTQSLAVVVAGPVIGRWVDRTSRWKAARISLASQNLLVIACAVCVALTFYFRDKLATETNGWGLAGACSLIVILGTLAHLASVASSIVVYKDWIVIIAGCETQKLAKMNSTCRSIDLATNMIAPIAVGQVMYFVSHIVAAVTIASWNVLSFFVEFLLLWRIYLEFPALAVKDKAAVKERQPLNAELSEEKSVVDTNHVENADETNQSKDSKDGFLSKKWQSLTKSWRIYFRHDVCNAGIGLACLYLTVLGFDSITMGYAYSQGVPESLLGILLAVGAGVGLLGSVAFPFFVRYLGIERTGLYGFAFEVACLTLCVGSIWAPGSPFDPSSVSFTNIDDPFAYQNISSNFSDSYEEGPESYTSVILLMTGMISARFGLWVADLSANQVLQEIDGTIRGTINGVQSSMNMIFDTTKFLLVIACPWPQTYGILVCISFSAICAGWCFFASYSFKKRGHLLPFHKIVDLIPPDQIHQFQMNELENKKKKESSFEEDEVPQTNQLT